MASRQVARGTDGGSNTQDGGVDSSDECGSPEPKSAFERFFYERFDSAFLHVKGKYDELTRLNVQDPFNYLEERDLLLDMERCLQNSLNHLMAYHPRTRHQRREIDYATAKLREWRSGVRNRLGINHVHLANQRARQFAINIRGRNGA